jgi:XTP/dITP diphosphohydrolase
MQSLCFATNNLHKLEEVRSAIGDQFQLTGLFDINCKDELPETHDTLEGNSFEKADYVFQHFSIPCFADDTGLEVTSLGGAPGVYSARYAGEHKNSEDNINLLLRNLSGIENRKARFRTVITLVGLTPQPQYFEGIINGTIGFARQGDKGFGYDAVFTPEGHHQTFAQMSMEQKNTLSHRGLAVKKLITFLKNYKA